MNDNQFLLIFGILALGAPIAVALTDFHLAEFIFSFSLSAVAFGGILFDLLGDEEKPEGAKKPEEVSG